MTQDACPATSGRRRRLHAGRPALICTALLLSMPAHAVDHDAGDYVAAPPGTSLFLLYGQHAKRNTLQAGGDRVPINAGLDSNVGIARAVHYMKIGGLTVAPQVLLPFGQLKGRDDTSTLGRTSGVGDIILAAPVWVINDADQRVYWGLTPYLYLPTGSYDADRALNLGENRWKLNLQSGFVKGLSPNWWAEVTGDVMLHGKNDEFGSVKATQKQKPLFQLQSYLRYQFNPGASVFAGLSHTWGGETRLNGVDNDDQPRQFKASLGGSYFVGPKTQLMAAVGRDLKVENGFKENFRLNLRLLQVF